MIHKRKQLTTFLFFIFFACSVSGCSNEKDYLLGSDPNSKASTSYFYINEENEDVSGNKIKVLNTQHSQDNIVLKIWIYSIDWNLAKVNCISPNLIYNWEKTKTLNELTNYSIPLGDNFFTLYFDYCQTNDENGFINFNIRKVGFTESYFVIVL